ncbi:MAG: nodulation efficiency protein D (NfeD) [Bacteroidales bacterium]|nr:nodulation efficiency protein D (NfeD) [Bacteroidales bacterium]
MDTLSILWISLLVFGFILFIVELFVVPGTSVVGIAGIVAVVYGLVRIFTDMGNTAGWIALIAVVAICSVITTWFVRTKSWKKITLNDELAAKVNVVDEQKIKVGDEGKALSRLVPMGQADFGGETYEVHSTDGFIDQKTSIKVVKIEGSKIFVTAL